jgi:DNA segregation ATPase FtsK/SpoIIIE-like protein
LTSKVSTKGRNRGSAKASGPEGRGAFFDLSPLVLLKHPWRLALPLAIAALIIAYPLRDPFVSTFGWSAAPLGAWAFGFLYLLSWRPKLLFRWWQIVIPLGLLAAAAAGVLGMLNAPIASPTGESMGGRIGEAIAIRPGQWDRFNVTNLQYAAASLRIFVLVIAALAIFTPRYSWLATRLSSRYTWRASRFTAATTKTALEKSRESAARWQVERRKKAGEKAAIDAALAAAAAEDTATASHIYAEPHSPIIHGIAVDNEDDFAHQAEDGAPPWEDDEDKVPSGPMKTALALRPLPDGKTEPGAGGDIATTALLSKAASMFKWPLPRLDILRKAPPGGVTRAEIDATSALIEESLAQHSIEVTVDQVFTGPTVTMYGLKPGWKGGATDSGKRVKVDMILNREKDLALALASPNLRFEPVVPGESVVGIEVPNSKPTPVTVRSVMESDEWKRFEQSAQLPVPLGLGSGGEPVFADLAKMPHTLIAGATGSGKSVCMNTIITGLLMSRTPTQVRMVMIDPKRVELTPYAGVPHLYTSVVVEADRAIATLKALVAEMMGRFRVLEQAGVKNIVSFNEKSETRMPYLVVLVDELADLMMLGKMEVERLLVRLAQLGRATGVHLVVATQRPSVDVVTGLIKANFPSRVTFAVMSQVDSRTVLDSVGGEKLLGRGDMLYLPIDKSKPQRVQGAFLSDAEIEATVRMWKAVKGPALPELEVEMEDEAIVDTDYDSSDGSLVDKAAGLARTQRTLSTSLLQRRLRIGYPRAARLMDQLEEMGIVGPGEPGKPRQVLGS